MKEPYDPIEELGNVLTLARLDNVDLFFQSEKLVEVIHMEIKHNVIPNLAEGSHQTLLWTDGTNNIFISIHVEGENQFTYSIELRHGNIA